MKTPYSLCKGITLFYRKASEVFRSFCTFFQFMDKLLSIIKRIIFQFRRLKLIQWKLSKLYEVFQQRLVYNYLRNSVSRHLPPSVPLSWLFLAHTNLFNTEDFEFSRSLTKALQSTDIALDCVLHSRKYVSQMSTRRFSALFDVVVVKRDKCSTLKYLKWEVKLDKNVKVAFIKLENN